MWKRVKCNQCKEYFEKWPELITAWSYKFCSKQHRLDFLRTKQRKEKEKVLERKKKVRDKKANSVSVLTKKADKLWSEAVKINYNYECQYCWKKEYLNSHHLYTRSRRATRWDIENGICLCSWCHTLSSNFSAHQTPLEFFERLEWIRWRDWIDELSNKSRHTIKVTPEFLHNRIKEIEDFIKKSNKKDWQNNK